VKEDESSIRSESEPEPGNVPETVTLQEERRLESQTICRCQVKRPALRNDASRRAAVLRRRTQHTTSPSASVSSNGKESSAHVQCR
jgi:hypothetical protein